MPEDIDKSDDLIEFVDDQPVILESEGIGQAPVKAKAVQAVWRVLISDDEEDVHQATKFALRDMEILGRKLEFYDAHNSQETLHILKTVPDIAVILLDVVMETSNSGLDLVPQIREDLGLRDIRIILRTGEPNQAPELSVIHNYDINDYKLKSDLTQKNLYASLTASIRSYQQIRTIENSKKGLDKIIRSSSELITTKGLHQFAEGVIVHMAALLHVPPEGVICVRKRDLQEQSEPTIIAAAGHYLELTDCLLTAIDKNLVRDLVQESLNNRSNIYHESGVAVYLGSHERGDMSCFIASPQGINEDDRGLLELFCGNISLCADNISFMEKLKSYAYTDSLVNLPNRNALEELVSAHINNGGNVPFSLALIDIDNFAEINAVLGQDYGDKLIRASAERLRGRFQDPNIVARVGGDTYAVFGPSSHIDRKALLQPFVTPFEIGGELQLLAVTAGIVPLFEVDGGGSEAIKDASIVLKEAKTTNRGDVVIFNRQMVTDAHARLDMLKNLRSAFELNQLFLVFQPKLKLSDLKVTGFEALLRWRNAKGEFVSPAEFIPLAEQSGLIIRMGEWILRNAIAELALLRAKGYTSVKMAVNISVAQLEHPDFLDMLRRVVGERAGNYRIGCHGGHRAKPRNFARSA